MKQILISHLRRENEFWQRTYFFLLSVAVEKSSLTIEYDAKNVHVLADVLTERAKDAGRFL